MLFQEEAAVRKRYVDGDETDLPDRDVQKLIVLTQKSSGDNHSHFDKGLTSLINDGLAHYEQEVQRVRRYH